MKKTQNKCAYKVGCADYRKRFLKRKPDKVAGMERRSPMSYITLHTRKHFRTRFIRTRSESAFRYCTCIAIDLPGKWDIRWAIFCLLGSIVFAVRREALGEGIPIVVRWLVFCMMPASYMSMCLGPLKQEMPRYREWKSSCSGDL